ncbi:MAG: Nif3-like dinuclear metal center hexameric protein [Deltaproteobacteria bacterium]|nr:MAG: Nif3-like dinuclear metal center hexameric protein [Deltaproteobacteria bacterium]
MARVQQIVEYLDDLLKVDVFPDAAVNGLQVEGREQISTVATCASVSADFFEQAVEEGAGLLLVHHGLLWNRPLPLIDRWLGRRLYFLLENELNLVAYHLPLDAHPEMGNNAQLAKSAGLEDVVFDVGRAGPACIGCRGRLPGGESLDELAGRLEAAVECKARVVGSAMPQGVEAVAVVSGAGGTPEILMEAKRAGCQVLVTGEVKEQSVAMLKEMEMAAVVLGHYNSEKLGVMELGDNLAEHFGLSVVHIDVPNPL